MVDATNQKLPLDVTHYLTQLIKFNTVSHDLLTKDQSNLDLITYMEGQFEHNLNLVFSFDQIPQDSNQNIKTKANLLSLAPNPQSMLLLLELLASLSQQELDLDCPIKYNFAPLLSGHSDVVPFKEEQWEHSPLEATICEQKLYGRGACDMKGFLSCMLSHYKSNQDSPLNYLVTSDEETSMAGAQFITGLFRNEELLANLPQEVPNLYQASQDPLHLDSFNLRINLHTANLPTLLELAQDKLQLQTQNLDSLSSLITALKIKPELLTLKYTQEHQLWELSFKVNRKVLATLKKVYFKLIVIGEPTQMKPIIAHKGWVSKCLHLYGQSAHSSNPAQGFNACSLLPFVLNEFQALSKTLEAQEKDSRFVVNYPTLNIGKIEGGVALNCVCDHIKLFFDLRPTPQFDAKLVYYLTKLVAKINEHIARLNTQNRPYNIKECELTSVFKAVAAFENTDQASLKLITEITPNTKFECVNYCTEASFLQEISPCVVMGPGNISQAHAQNEYIEISELQYCLDFLNSLAKLS